MPSITPGADVPARLPRDRRWSRPLQWLHWGMALLLIAQVALGWIAAGWRLSPTKLDLFVWHKSLGLVLLGLVAVRLALRWSTAGPPRLAVPGWQLRAARVSHGLLYLLLIAMPLSGWIISSAANLPFKWFWLWPVPDLVGQDQGLRDLAGLVHLGLFWLLALVLAAHLYAAWRHHWRLRDEALIRMLPWR